MLIDKGVIEVLGVGYLTSSVFFSSRTIVSFQSSYLLHLISLVFISVILLLMLGIFFFVN